jgi:hypothetical protein
MKNLLLTRDSRAEPQQVLNPICFAERHGNNLVAAATPLVQRGVHICGTDEPEVDFFLRRDEGSGVPIAGIALRGTVRVLSATKNHR